jgi:hypothetical protein
MASFAAPGHPVLRHLAIVRAARDFGLQSDDLDALALRLPQFQEAPTSSPKQRPPPCSSAARSATAGRSATTSSPRLAKANHGANHATVLAGALVPRSSRGAWTRNPCNREAAHRGRS